MKRERRQDMRKPNDTGTKYPFCSGSQDIRTLRQESQRDKAGKRYLKNSIKKKTSGTNHYVLPEPITVPDERNVC